MMLIKEVLHDIALFCASSSFLISLFTVVLIFLRVRPLMSNVPILLTCNTYFAVSGSSFMTLLVMVYGLYDSRDLSIAFNDYHCQLRSYINYIFVCAFFYSCALHAVFRLFRVVFPKRKVLQARGVFIVAISMQWLVSIFYITAYLLLGNFEYQDDIGSCWLPITNISAFSTAMAFMYGTPLIVMGGIYACIVRHIRHTVQTQQIRQLANKRDLLVVKRMLILVLIAMNIGIPSGILLILYMITNYLTPLAYHIQALTFTLGLVIESIVLGFITPQVREIFKKNRQQVIPVITDISMQQRRIETGGNSTAFQTNTIH